MSGENDKFFAAVNEAISFPIVRLRDDIQIVPTEEPLFERMFAGVIKGHFEVMPEEMINVARDPNELNAFLRKFRALASYKYDQEYICDLWNHALEKVKNKHDYLEPISFQIQRFGDMLSKPVLGKAPQMLGLAKKATISVNPVLAIGAVVATAVMVYASHKAKTKSVDREAKIVALENMVKRLKLEMNR